MRTTFGVDRLQTLLAEIETRVLNVGLAVEPSGGAAIAALEISSDGRRLFLIAETGKSSGAQPG